MFSTTVKLLWISYLCVSLWEHVLGFSEDCLEELMKDQVESNCSHECHVRVTPLARQPLHCKWALDPADLSRRTHNAGKPNMLFPWSMSNAFSIIKALRKAASHNSEKLLSSFPTEGEMTSYLCFLMRTTVSFLVAVCLNDPWGQRAPCTVTQTFFITAQPTKVVIGGSKRR